MYHLSWADTSPAAPAAAVDSTCSGPAGSATIDQLREVRPHHVEQAEDDGGDDRHDDHDEGRGADFLGGGPRDLLELGGNLVGEAVDALVAVRPDAHEDREQPREHGDVQLARGSTEVPPEPVDAPLGDVEQRDPA